jgi:hypothetical protein
VAYTTLEGRQELLDALAAAVDDIGLALAMLGAAYEALDQATADHLEDQLFGPVQRAYGRSKRAYASFAERAGLTATTFESQSSGLPSTGAKGFIENATNAIGAAGGELATLQDSPKMLEVGDEELRRDLIELRELIADVPQRARDLVRRLGR